MLNKNYILPNKIIIIVYVFNKIGIILKRIIDLLSAFITYLIRQLYI